MARIPTNPQPKSVTNPRGAALPQPPQRAESNAAPTRAGWSGAARAAPKSPLASLDATLTDARSAVRGKLNFPASVAGVPVKSANELQYSGVKGDNELMLRGADVQFGKLSPSQFDALKAEFGGRSQARYDANRSYSATDFLPPMLQGLIGKDLDTGAPVEIPGTEALAADLMSEGNLTIGSSPNCHGTAWEAARAFQGQTGAHVQFAYGDATTAQGVYLDLVKVARTEPGQKLDLSKLKPGDIVSFGTADSTGAERDLLHSAVYAGGGLFFEKPDTESDDYRETPYRLVTLEQALAPIKHYVGDEPLVLTSLRPKGPLASPAQTFAATDGPNELEALLQKRGETTGKPLVLELYLGMGGGVKGMSLNAVLTKRLEVDAQGRGVLR